MNPWSILSGNTFGISNGGDVLKSNVGSLYQLFLAVGIVGLAATLIMGFIKLALGRNSAERSEWKQEIKGKLACGVALFGGTAILSIIWGISDGLIKAAW